MKKESKPIFIGVSFKGETYSPKEIPKEFIEKHVCNPIIKVLCNKGFKIE